MDSEIEHDVLSEKEHHALYDLFMIDEDNFPRMSDIGLYHIDGNDLAFWYQHKFYPPKLNVAISDKEKWFLAKIKYGI